MDDGKEKLKELFFKNVYGLSPNIENYNKKHAGAKGHWLEKKLGKNPDSDNSADFWGYECKNFTKSLTTWGDWTANKYIFDKKNNFNLDRDHFLQIFGKPNREKNNRCSWSGEPVPSYPNKFSNFGQLMTIDEFSNIKIQYSFLKDKRENKSYILPKEFQIENLELAVWYGYEKYNQTIKHSTKINDTLINIIHVFM